MKRKDKRPIDIGTKLYLSTDINQCAEENSIYMNLIQNKEGLKEDYVKTRQDFDGEIPEECDRYFIVEVVGEIKLEIKPIIKLLK